jgi:hypothetical protein
MTPDRFAIIPMSPGPAPADAIMTGSMSAVMERIVDSQARADALEQAARAVEDAVEAERKKDEARACAVQMIADTVAHLASRLDSLTARRAERARRDAEREAEEEAKRIQAELDALPDSDDPDAHTAGGELHALPAKDEQPTEPTEEDDDMGGVPMSYKSVPLSYVRGKRDQAEFPEPEDPTGTVIPQPTAIEFDGD